MHSVLRRIAAYMAARTHRSAIDPTDIDPDLLPHLFLIDVLCESGSATPRLRVRLTGTALDLAFGRSVKGRSLEEFLHGPRSAEVLDTFYACARDHAPVWMRQIVEIRNQPARYVEGVVYHLDPNAICGGLIVGEMTTASPASSFERRFL